MLAMTIVINPDTKPSQPVVDKTIPKKINFKDPANKKNAIYSLRKF